jgi:hypothetical protein
VAALLVWAFFQIPDVTFPGIPKPARPTWLSPAIEAIMAAAFDLAASRMKPGDRLLTHVDDEFNNGLILPAAERHRKVFKIGIPAAIMFKNQFSTEDLELLQRTGGTVLASMGPLPPRLDALPKVGAFGPFEVRTLPGLPRAWLDGPGELEIVSFEDDAVRVRIRGSSARTRLRLGIAFFKTWRADDGTPATPFAFREATLTELRAHDGEMVVRYHAPLSQPVGLAISLLGWGGLLAWGGHRWSRRRKLPRPAEA